MGVPGLPPERVGVEAECAALQEGVASRYPAMQGHPGAEKAGFALPRSLSRRGDRPRRMRPDRRVDAGSFAAFLMCSQFDPAKNKILFIDPGFPVQRSQVRILGIPSESFDIYDFRGEKLGPKIESYLAAGDVAAIVYSNPQQPGVGLPDGGGAAHDRGLATEIRHRHRGPRLPLHGFPQAAGTPLRTALSGPPSPATRRTTSCWSRVRRYSATPDKRIAVAALSETLRRRDYPALRRRYNIGRLGDAFVLVFLYAASSGTSHSAQHALAAMFRRGGRRRAGFRGRSLEYARRARLTKEAFLRHGFRIVSTTKTATRPSATDSSTRWATAR